jgi:hypothetical protein
LKRNSAKESGIMATSIPPIRHMDYIDTEGNKHTIEERWHIISYFVNGNSEGTQKSPKTDIYIDNKLWTEIDEAYMEDPFEKAQVWIESQIQEQNDSLL